MAESLINSASYYLGCEKELTCLLILIFDLQGGKHHLLTENYPCPFPEFAQTHPVSDAI